MRKDLGASPGLWDQAHAKVKAVQWCAMQHGPALTAKFICSNQTSASRICNGAAHCRTFVRPTDFKERWGSKCDGAASLFAWPALYWCEAICCGDMVFCPRTCNDHHHIEHVRVSERNTHTHTHHPPPPRRWLVLGRSCAEDWHAEVPKTHHLMCVHAGTCAAAWSPFELTVQDASGTPGAGKAVQWY